LQAYIWSQQVMYLPADPTLTREAVAGIVHTFLDVLARY